MSLHPSSLPSPLYVWIDTPQALDAACADVAHADVIALDTEFFRENTFFPVPALIQFSAGGAAYLVDPTVTPCTEAFRALLQGAAIKLLHACSEDLEVFLEWAGTLPTPMIDTQVAQAFLGPVPGMGYQKLVALWMNETLPKEETRSNWLERPLSPAQCDYAALDVIYLYRVWALQSAVLAERGRLAWVSEECSALVEQAGRSGENDTQWYTRQRQLWRLAPRALAAYRALTTWREGETRRRNLPRNWLVSDKLLFAIAEAMPSNRYELAAVEGVKPTLVKKEGDTLLALVKAAAYQPEESLEASWPDPARADFKQRFKAVKRVANAAGEELGMAPEMLLRRRDIEALVMAHLKAQPLALPLGWRGDYLGQRIEKALDEVTQ
ncbi:ribonuclease D [Halomonas dongshanensis]|uniref:ribonuclease D n=1 Tax=Halomonas dongshanensis TaxID=2890835 RepID=UPI003CFC7201